MSMYDMALMAHMLASTAIVVSAVSQSLVAMFFAFLAFEVSTIILSKQSLSV
jgi:hypothetical protein